MIHSARLRPAVPWEPLDLVFQAAAGAGAIVLAVLALVRLPGLPERVPVHFDAAGRPDGWGSPKVLLAVVVMGLVLTAVLVVLARFPQVYNYPFALTPENTARQYRLARRLILGLSAYTAWLFAWLFEATSRVAEGSAPGLAPWLLLVVTAVPLISVGSYFFAAARAR